MLGWSGGVCSAPDLGILEFLRDVLCLVEMNLERRLRIEETDKLPLDPFSEIAGLLLDFNVGEAKCVRLRVGGGEIAIQNVRKGGRETSEVNLAGRRRDRSTHLRALMKTANGGLVRA